MRKGDVREGISFFATMCSVCRFYCSVYNVISRIILPIKRIIKIVYFLAFVDYLLYLCNIQRGYL